MTRIIGKAVTVILLLLMHITEAQKTNYVWCFGDSAGIGWTDSLTTYTFKSNLQGRGSCASVADTAGNLLFYANVNFPISSGYRGMVWNKNLAMMDNGDSINGEAWYNEIVIVPMPAHPSRYYIFSVNVAGINQFGLYYAIADLSLNGGLGAVTQKNIPLQPNVEMADCISAIKHGNGRDWWIFFRRAHNFTGGPFDNRFYRYLVTPAGISAVAYQDIGSVNVQNLTKITFSNRGNKMVFNNGNGLIEMFDFDRCSGLLSNPVIIRPSATTGLYIMSVAFSPNDSILYATGFLTSTLKSYLLQFDLHAVPISNSADTISSILHPIYYYGLLKGPDDKIYLSSADESCGGCYPYPDSVRTIYNENLSVILSPDSLGATCDFQPFGFYLGGARSYYALPNNPNYGLPPVAGSVCDTIVAGIESMEYTQNHFTFFPNPASSTLHLITEDYVNGYIFNTAGQVVLFLRNEKEIMISDLPPGAYSIQLQFKSGAVISKKLIIT